jgi:hypothetical protein
MNIPVYVLFTQIHPSRSKPVNIASLDEFGLQSNHKIIFLKGGENMSKTVEKFECDAHELSDRLDATEADCCGNGGSSNGLVLWGNGTLTQEFEAYGVHSKYIITPLGDARFSVVKVVNTPDYEPSIES